MYSCIEPTIGAQMWTDTESRRLFQFDRIFPAADTLRLVNPVQLQTYPYQLSSDGVQGLWQVQLLLAETG